MFLNNNFFNQKEFNNGSLKLQGYFKVKRKDKIWSTGKLNIIGSCGNFNFKNLPSYMEVKDYDTNKTLDNINVGESFYLVSNKKPEDNLTLDINYKLIELYFYKYHSGGLLYNGYKTIQDLVRGSLSNGIKTTSLILNNNGNIEKPNKVQVAGSTNKPIKKPNKAQIIDSTINKKTNTIKLPKTGIEGSFLKSGVLITLLFVKRK